MDASTTPSRGVDVTAGNFHGRATVVVENGSLRIEVLAHDALRVVRFGLANTSLNVFAEIPDVTWGTEYGRVEALGGHRLWRAPQSLGGADAPDGDVTIDVSADTVTMVAQPSPAGDAKTMQLVPSNERSSVTVIHELRNETASSVRWAPWAITQLRLGGVAVVPLDDPDPDSASSVPNRALILWPQASATDPRLLITADCLLVRGDPAPLTKFGTFSSCGRIGYYNRGMLFKKIFAVSAFAEHPDRGCNVEVYTDASCLELESLAPLTTLAPGASATHVERWELTVDDIDPSDTAALRSAVLSDATL